MTVNRNNLDRAVKAALEGPEARNVRIKDYSFNIKPATITRNGNTVTVEGGDNNYISRRRRLANDRFYYKFVKSGEHINLNEININRSRGGFWGGIARYWREITDVVIEIIEKILEERRSRTGTSQSNLMVASEVQDIGYQETLRFLDGSPRGEAAFIIANIAIAVETTPSARLVSQSWSGGDSGRGGLPGGGNKQLQ